MFKVGRTWLRFLQRVGLAFLALNLMAASVPRCHLLFSLFHKAETPNSQAAVSSPCHEEAAEAARPAWTSERLCSCSLLQFLAFRLDPFAIQDYVKFLIQSEYRLSFADHHLLADYRPSPEPPYPKV